MEKLSDQRIFVVFAIIIMQTIAEDGLRDNLSSSPVTKLNYTKESWNAAANLLLSGMNKGVDRCEDFYEYACGNRSNKMLNYVDDTSTKIGKKLENYLLRNIIDNDTVAEQKAKLSFQICMNEEKIEKYGLNGIEEILRSNGRWPIIDNNWIENAIPWQQIHNKYMNEYGVFGLFSVEVAPDLGEADGYRIWLKPTSQLRISPFEYADRFEDNQFVSAYFSYITDIIQEMDYFKQINGSVINLLEPVTNLIIFERNLANITSLIHPADIASELMTIDQLQEFYDSAYPQNSTSQINWLSTIQSTFANISDIRIDGQKQIRVVDKYFFKKLVYMLDLADEEKIVNYIHWKLVDETVMYTTRKMIKGLHDFLFYRTRYNYDEPREIWCRGVAELTHVTDYVYVQEHLSNYAITWVQIVFEQIKESMADLIDESLSLDNQTKKLMKFKLNNTKAQIGHPNWYTEKRINNYYKDLEVGHNFFYNMLNRRRFELKNNRRLLTTSVDINKWQIRASSVESYYNPRTNIVTIPAGILQYPFFDAQRPEFMNFGWIGTIIGKLIARAYDFSVKANVNLYKSRGQRALKSTRKETNINEYNKNEIYENTDKIIYADGLDLLTEHIADAVGIELSLRVYIRILKSRGIDENSFDSSELRESTNDQLYFLWRAIMSCSNHPKKLWSYVPRSRRVSKKIQLLGALSNLESFRRAYGCSNELTIRGIEKCAIFNLPETKTKRTQRLSHINSSQLMN